MRHTGYVTPAVEQLRKSSVSHDLTEYGHDPRSGSYGAEAVDALGLDPELVFKTLVADVADVGLVVAVVPVSGRLDLKALAKAAGGKKAAMADPARAERTTGYVRGGISPLGQRKRLPTVIDSSANLHARIHVSAGRRGLEVSLAPTDLALLLSATFAKVAT